MEVANKITVSGRRAPRQGSRDNGSPADEADFHHRARAERMALVRSVNSSSGLSEEADRIAIEVVRAYRRSG